MEVADFSPTKVARGVDLLLLYCCQSPITRAAGSRLFVVFAGKKESRRADSTADLLTTSDRSGVAGSCRRLQNPHSQAASSATACPVLHRIALPVVSEWCQKSLGYTSPGTLRPMGE
jgi:hypothetical protein